MSTEELREAVEAVERSLEANYTTGASVHRCMATIARALRDQEAEIARLTYRLETANGYGEQCDNDIRALLERAEKAEALLREIHDAGYYRNKITAHLGGEHG